MNKQDLKAMIKWRDNRIDELESIINKIHDINNRNIKNSEKGALIALAIIIEPPCISTREGFLGITLISKPTKK